MVMYGVWEVVLCLECGKWFYVWSVGSGFMSGVWEVVMSSGYVECEEWLC